MEKSPETQVLELMPRLSLAAIIAVPTIGFILSMFIEMDLESFNRMLLIGAMLFPSVTSIVIVRLVVLPTQSAAGSPRSNLFTIGFAEAMTPAILCGLGAIFAGAWWLALVGGALGVVSWITVRDYLEGLPVNFGHAES